MAFLWRAKGTQFFDNSGNPLNGGKLAYFDAGTTSAKTVYQDSDEQTAWGSIVLDSSGRLEYSIYVGSGAFKERLRTSADVDIYTEDDIPGETVLTVDTFARPNMPVLSKSLSYTVLQDDIGSMIQADPTGGDVTITLISAVTAGDGAQVGVQHVGTAGKVIVAVPGGQTVNGASTVTIRVPRAGAVFTSNAGVWSGPVSAAPFATLSKTTTYTVGVVDHGKTIKADATGGAFTITLPAATDAGDGFEITVVKIDSSNTVTLDGDGSETINGSANFSLSRQWQAVTLRCDGSNWQALTAPRAIPASSTDNAIARYDGTSGLLQTSSVTIDDSNNLSTAGSYNSTGTDGNQLPTGTTAQRPTPSQGHIRHNTDLDVTEAYNGSAWRLLDRPLLHLREQQTANTAGTTITTGAFRTMVLNTEVTDEIGSTLSSNQWTLPAGTYEIMAMPPAGATGSASAYLMKTKLRNITDGSDTIIGPTSSVAANASGTAPLVGRFTIAATKTFEFQLRCTTELTLPAANLGVVEVYAEVMIWRIA